MLFHLKIRPQIFVNKMITLRESFTTFFQWNFLPSQKVHIQHMPLIIYLLKLFKILYDTRWQEVYDICGESKVLEFGQLPTISHLKLRQEVVGAIFYGWTYFPFASYHTCFLLYRVNINVVAWYILINWFCQFSNKLKLRILFLLVCPHFVARSYVWHKCVTFY
jgi:hypothetical protein